MSTETREVINCDKCYWELEKDDTYFSDSENDYCIDCMGEKAKQALWEDFKQKVDFKAEKASNFYEFFIRNAFDEKPYIRACDMLWDIIDDDELEADASQWTDILECVCNQEYFKCRIINEICDNWYDELVAAYTDFADFEKRSYEK